MKLRTLLGGLTLCCAASTAMASPVCGSSSTLGGSSGLFGLSGSFGNSFNSANTYTDCFTFSLAGEAKFLTGDLDLKDALNNKLNISVNSVSLYQGETLLGKAATPLLGFAFTSLAGGAAVYTLQVVTTVSNVLFASRWRTDDPVGYSGKITPLASPAPEPAAYALIAAGFAIVGVSAWRRRRL